MTDEYFAKETAIAKCIERLGLPNNLGSAVDLEPIWEAAKAFYTTETQTLKSRIELLESDVADYRENARY